MHLLSFVLKSWMWNYKLDSRSTNKKEEKRYNYNLRSKILQVFSVKADSCDGKFTNWQFRCGNNDLRCSNINDNKSSHSSDKIDKTFLRHPNSRWLTKAVAYSAVPWVNFDLGVSDDDVISKANRFRPVMPRWGPSSQRSVIHVDLPLHRQSDNIILSQPLTSPSCYITIFMTNRYIYTVLLYIHIHTSQTWVIWLYNLGEK